MEIGGCRKTNKGKTLINMGAEVNLASGCMFDWAFIYTVPYFLRGETFYHARQNISKMQIWGCT